MKISKRFSISRLAVLLAFFTNGALFATWASRIPAVQLKLSLSEGTLGLVLVGLPVGLLSALVLVSFLIAKWGSKKVVLITALTSCTALIVLALAPNPIILFLTLMIFGGGLSAMDVAMNEQAVLVERQAGKPIMSSFHAGYSIGGFAGSILSAGTAALTSFSTLAYFSASALLFGGLILIAYQKLLIEKTNKKSGQPVFQLPSRPLWILGLVGLAGAFGEGVSADWSAVFLTQVHQANPSIAALGFAAFSLTMTAGRILGDWLTAKLKPAGIVRTGGALSCAGFLLVVSANAPALVIIGFALVGLGLANIIPVLFSVAGNLPGISPGSGIAGVATISYIGFLAGPPLMGGLTELFSFRIALALIALMVGSMFFSSNALKTKKGAAHDN